MRKLLAGPAYDKSLARDLSRCPVPTLVLVGKDDGVIPPENGRTYLNLMPDVTLVEFANAAHDIQGDRPEDLVGVVTRFLKGQRIEQLPDANVISTHCADGRPWWAAPLSRHRPSGNSNEINSIRARRRGQRNAH